MSKGRDFFLSFLYFLVDPIVSRAPVGSAAVTMGGHVPLSGSASSSPLKKLPGTGWLDHGAARGLPFREDTLVRVPPAGRGVPPSPHVSRCVGSAPPTGARVRLGPSSRTRGRRRLLSARTVGPGAPAAFTSASSAARAPPSWGRHPASGVSRALRGHAEQGPVPPRGPTSSVLPPVAFANPRNRDRDGRPGSRHQSSLRGGSRSQPWAPVLTAPRPVFCAVPESRPVPRFCPQLSVWSLNSSFYGAEIFNFHKGQFVR